eukprot:15159294-Ditylum_brightwellii.AAC.1
MSTYQSNEKRDKVIDTINDCLLWVEGYLGGEGKYILGADYPNITIATKELIGSGWEVLLKLGNLKLVCKPTDDSLTDLVDRKLRGGCTQPLEALKHIVERLRGSDTLATKAIEEARAYKRSRVERHAPEMDLEDKFVSHLGLNCQRAYEEEKKDSEHHLGFNEHVGKLEQNVVMLSDTLATIKGQKVSEIMVVENGGKLFKGKQDVTLQMEEKLLDTYPFGVFVACNVLLEMVLVVHSNV